MPVPLSTSLVLYSKQDNKVSVMNSRLIWLVTQLVLEVLCLHWLTILGRYRKEAGHVCLVLKLFMFSWPCLQIILSFYVELKMVADVIIVNYYQQHSNTRYFAIIASTGTAPLIL